MYFERRINFFIVLFVFLFILNVEYAGAKIEVSLHEPKEPKFKNDAHILPYWSRSTSSTTRKQLQREPSSTLFSSNQNATLSPKEILDMAKLMVLPLNEPARQKAMKSFDTRDLDQQVGEWIKDNAKLQVMLRAGGKYVELRHLLTSPKAGDPTMDRSLRLDLPGARFWEAFSSGTSLSTPLNSSSLTPSLKTTELPANQKNTTKPSKNSNTNGSADLTNLGARSASHSNGNTSNPAIYNVANKHAEYNNGVNNKINNNAAGFIEAHNIITYNNIADNNAAGPNVPYDYSPNLNAALHYTATPNAVYLNEAGSNASDNSTIFYRTSNNAANNDAAYSNLVNPNAFHNNAGVPNSLYSNAADPNGVYINAADPNAIYLTAADPNAVYNNAVNPNTVYYSAIDPNANAFNNAIDPNANAYNNAIDPNAVYNNAPNLIAINYSKNYAATQKADVARENTARSELDPTNAVPAHSNLDPTKAILAHSDQTKAVPAHSELDTTKAVPISPVTKAEDKDSPQIAAVETKVSEMIEHKKEEEQMYDLSTPAWSDMPSLEPESSTTTPLMPTTNTTASTLFPRESDRHPMVQRAYDHMKEFNLHHFSAFVVTLTEVVAVNKEGRITKLVESFENAIATYEKQGVWATLGPTTALTLTRTTQGVHRMPPAYLENVMERLYHKFRNHSTMSPKTRAIIEELESWYTLAEGVELFKSIGDISDYPANNKNADSIVQHMCDIIMEPFIRMGRYSARRIKFLRDIEKALTDTAFKRRHLKSHYENYKENTELTITEPDSYGDSASRSKKERDVMAQKRFDIINDRNEYSSDDYDYDSTKKIEDKSKYSTEDSDDYKTKQKHSTKNKRERKNKHKYYTEDSESQTTDEKKYSYSSSQNEKNNRAHSTEESEYREETEQDYSSESNKNQDYSRKYAEESEDGEEIKYDLRRNFYPITKNKVQKYEHHKTTHNIMNDVSSYLFRVTTRNYEFKTIYNAKENEHDSKHKVKTSTIRTYKHGNSRYKGYTRNDFIRKEVLNNLKTTPRRPIRNNVIKTKKGTKKSLKNKVVQRNKKDKLYRHLRNINNKIKSANKAYNITTTPKVEHFDSNAYYDYIYSKEKLNPHKLLTRHNLRDQSTDKYTENKNFTVQPKKYTLRPKKLNKTISHDDEISDTFERYDSKFEYNLQRDKNPFKLAILDYDISDISERQNKDKAFITKLKNQQLMSNHKLNYNEKDSNSFPVTTHIEIYNVDVKSKDSKGLSKGRYESKSTPKVKVTNKQIVHSNKEPTKTVTDKNQKRYKIVNPYHSNKIRMGSNKFGHVKKTVQDKRSRYVSIDDNSEENTEDVDRVHQKFYENFQSKIDTKDNVAKNILEESSYSDVESDIKFKLNDALRHGDMKILKNSRRGIPVPEKKAILDVTSEVDEEGVIKNNMYKALIGNTPFNFANDSR